MTTQRDSCDIIVNQEGNPTSTPVEDLRRVVRENLASIIFRNQILHTQTITAPNGVSTYETAGPVRITLNGRSYSASQIDSMTFSLNEENQQEEEPLVIDNPRASGQKKTFKDLDRLARKLAGRNLDMCTVSRRIEETVVTGTSRNRMKFVDLSEDSDAI
jgi:hypothetical protein